MQNWQPPQTTKDQAEMLQGMTDLDLYFQSRDTVVPYVAPDKIEVDTYTSPSNALTDLIVSVSKPAVVLSIVSGTVWVIVSGMVAVAGAVLSFVSANAAWIGGVGFCVVFVFVSLASFFRSDETEPQPAKPSGPVGQAVNITINVAGDTVTTNTNQK